MNNDLEQDAPDIMKEEIRATMEIADRFQAGYITIKEEENLQINKMIINKEKQQIHMNNNLGQNALGFMSVGNPVAMKDAYRIQTGHMIKDEENKQIYYDLAKGAGSSISNEAAPFSNRDAEAKRIENEQFACDMKTEEEKQHMNVCSEEETIMVKDEKLALTIKSGETNKNKTETTGYFMFNEVETQLIHRGLDKDGTCISSIGEDTPTLVEDIGCNKNEIETIGYDMPKHEEIQTNPDGLDKHYIYNACRDTPMTTQCVITNKEEIDALEEGVMEGSNKEEIKTSGHKMIKEEEIQQKHDEVDDQPYNCDICGRMFAMKDHLIKHITLHLSEDHCNKRSTYDKKNSKKKLYTCEICFYESAGKLNLVKHMRIHTGKKPFKCGICGYEFSFRHGLNRHMKRRHSDNKHGKNEKVLARNGNTEERLEFSKTDYNVNSGIGMYSNREQLKLHANNAGSSGLKLENNIVVHDRPGTLHLSGDHCNKKSTYNKKNSEKKLYTCEICFYESAGKLSLVKHMRIHSGKKPFKCGVCGYELSFKHGLNRHMKRRHSDNKHGKNGKVLTGNGNTEERLEFSKTDYSVKSDIGMYCNREQLKLHANNAGSSDLKLENIVVVHDRPGTHRKPYKSYKCQICSYSSRSKYCLVTHVRIHSDDKPFKCDSCDYSCKSKNGLVAHTKRRHSDERPYKCDICTYASKEKAGMTRHMRTRHSNEKPFKCGECDISFSLKGHLTKHQKTHKYMYMYPGAREKPHKCDSCSYSCENKYVLDRHKIIHTGVKPFKCNVCGYEFSFRNHLVQHKRTHTDERPYECDLCGKRFRRSDQLKNHNKVHSDNKPYTCSVCKKAFKGIEGLILHRKIHVDEKHYLCDICGSAFRTKGSLYLHSKIHSKERQYICGICGMGFYVKSYLDLHRRTHTGEKPYACDICSYKCSRRDHLKQHMRVHTGEKPYKCEICGHACYSKSNLTTHLRSHTRSKSCK